MKMQSFTGLSHLLLILLAQLVPAQISPKPEDATPKDRTFMKVFKKSICQPMEQLMDVEQELGSIYKPSCVSLRRCSGCCLDEAMECHPTLERNITLQVMKICSVQTEELVELTFVEHQACECRIRHRKRSVQQQVHQEITLDEETQEDKWLWQMLVPSE
ncbi:vascular endothelial growth factor A-like isoform X2 [Solea senegalensis]|uniref:Vascular endothelial growth factor A-like isoform X2 n=1 Tax=Solea senegalensis TaxID=28829 RepID=A0AAV6RWG7_SOLSE|nr:vascular endothelial growth factor A-like isoform X2 [Solea senegalensis]